ncbi:1-acyl-sn-glycerol-3-phosphate acyltransferase [Geojedonia litorea]|uniref:1-acyl-sn-glycerol-3-phosphate acyltransferase n=1 Tax=Geojedonia litorea TaxID=1268269 RepID=A0ABV9MZP6_9FLAO
MKLLWLHIVRAYLNLGLFFYYKKVKLVYKERLPKHGPVLFVGNHQNALMDALLIATKSGRFCYFLTRANVFKKPLAAAFLKSLRMLPVYRLRDGWNELSKNEDIFDHCAKLLKQEHAIALFPEATHNLQRRVRPLSKGFTRIIFEVFNQSPDLQLQLVPIGFNFLKAEDFGDAVTVYIGNTIPLTAGDCEDQHGSVIRLKEQVSKQFRQLTTHIPLENYDRTTERLEALQVDFLNPEAVNRCIQSDFKNCEKAKHKSPYGLKVLCKFLLLISVCLPYIIWKQGIQPKIVEIEFMATFRFVVVITLVPIWLLLVTVVLLCTVGSIWALGYILITLLLAVLAVKL